MPKHDFGIMQAQPVYGKSYSNYEPKKYNCISVDDDLIMPISEKLSEIKCYWHTLDRPETGLAYFGITLIPPGSLGTMIEMIRDNPELSELSALISEAEKENKYVIHFGI